MLSRAGDEYLATVDYHSGYLHNADRTILERMSVFRETDGDRHPKPDISPNGGETTALKNDDTGTTTEIPTPAPSTSRYGRYIRKPVMFAK